MERLSDDILSYIFSFIHEYYGNWFSVKLTCKRFLRCSIKPFDPTLRNNEALRSALTRGKIVSAEYLFKDERVRSTMDLKQTMELACHLGYSTMLNNLMEQFDCKDYAMGAAHDAVNSGHYHILFDIAGRFDVSRDYRSFFVSACREKRNVDAMSMIKKGWLDAETKINSLERAVFDVGLTKEMLKAEGVTQTAITNALRSALSSGYTDSFLELLAIAKGFIDVKTVRKMLIDASNQGNFRAVEALMELPHSDIAVVEKCLQKQIGQAKILNMIKKLKMNC